MALNKILQGMLDDFRKDYMFETLEPPKAFEYFVNYLIISKYHPDAFSDKGDMDRVIVDEKSQFGLDAIAFIVNGNLVLGKDDISIYAKSKKLDVDILLIQTKTEEKCDTGDLLKTIQATKNFLGNFDDITEKNSNILNAKEIYDELFKYENFRYCTSQSPKCHIYFVTAANEWEQTLVDSICKSSEESIESFISDIKNVDVQVLGRDYIIDAYSEIKNSISVQINLKNCITLDRIAGVKEAYIGYLTGEDYLKIICDNNGDIRRRIFYENVRDYQGVENSVNKEIRATIKEKKTRGQFILLNNGVTIITKSVVPLGANTYELSDFQIVNGCQTSNEIYNCKGYASDIFVPIKIIYTTDTDIISSIVKATNRQSPVPEEAFVALNKYHKELQLLFSEYSKDMPLAMFYERRSGEEDDIKEKKGAYQVVTLHGIIRSFESVYCQNPNMVYGTNPANILKSQNDNLFCKSHKPEIYYVASYLFVKFVSMQQRGYFSKHDYVLRFYVIMVTRMLMVNTMAVPDLSSNAMDKECKKMMAILKDDINADKYFLKAKEIVEKALNEREYSDKKRYEVLRSVEFCRSVKERTERILKAKK
ncbi:MAG: AIPR family protein [Blautia sp.]|nr:AIPR family protein [Blautia sp.]